MLLDLEGCNCARIGKLDNGHLIYQVWVTREGGVLFAFIRTHCMFDKMPM